MGSRMVWVPVVSGPLAPYAAGFESWLASRAYSASAAADRLYQFDQLSRWLGREGLSASELTGEHAVRFAAGRRAAGLKSWTSPHSVALPLQYLRQLGAAPVPAPVIPQGPLEELLADYCRYLSVERRLSGAERTGEHKTSTLQDLERGRPLEFDVLLAAVVELADLTGAEVPTLRAVGALADLLDRQLASTRSSPT